MNDTLLQPEEWARYERQLSLPEMTPAHQARLKSARIVMIGAGGLGAAALPYLAGSGIGHITVIDHDAVAVSNLQRQTIYTTAQAGQSKAERAADYLRALNPYCTVRAITEKITSENAQALCEGHDLILDGSDNFETKALLNRISITACIPLISASLHQFTAGAGLFAGFAAESPCYACLFPELPEEARNCSEAGILGTAAGIPGLYQAHMALCFLTGIGPIDTGTILSFDFKTLRMQKLHLSKDPACRVCAGQRHEPAIKEGNTIMPFQTISLSDLKSGDYYLIDVRSMEEVSNDPLPGAHNIPLAELATRTKEIPTDKPLALVCLKGIRSRQGCEMLRQYGFENLSIVDRNAAA